MMPSIKHCSNEEMMLQDIFIPSVDETRQNIGASEKQPILAIFDHHIDQMTICVIQKL